jgi:hypothetical protein
MSGSASAVLGPAAAVGSVTDQLAGEIRAWLRERAPDHGDSAPRTSPAVAGDATRTSTAALRHGCLRPKAQLTGRWL